MSNNWQYTVIRGVSKIVCLFSYPTVLFVGRGLGPLMKTILKKQQKRGVFHVMRGLGCSEKKAEWIIDAMFKNLGQSLVEILYTPNLKKQQVLNQVSIDHPERIEAALKEQKGVIILTGHFGNWEWLGAVPALYGFPVTVIVKKQPNDQVTRFLNENREMMGIEIFVRGGNEMICAARSLKRKKILGFLADQDGGFYGVPQMFLGKMASTPRGPATFAEKFHSPILPIFAVHDKNHHNQIIVGEVMHYEDTGHPEEDIARLTRKMASLTEQFIKDHPTEWLWFQHRWST
ncbi:MAG: lysophospholipid acyltransferase family protein, partial [Megasphaera sp.]|nr:lysophospholipid acyltransferase family protein [Megasphaera sp.]